jgi:hypothetical protein
VKAEQAWIEAIADWTSGSKNLKFPPAISNFFHATEQMNCETTTSQNGMYILKAAYILPFIPIYEQ